MADFRKEYTPKTDLIYGIGIWISCYIHHHGTGERPKGKLPDKDFKAAQDKKDKEFFAINTYNTALNSAQLKQLKKRDPSVVAYQAELDKSANLGRAAAKGPTTLLKSNARLNPRDPVQVKAAADDISVRRSCKFGIEYVTQKLGGRIHYALDGIDIGKVVDRGTVRNKSGFEKVPICTSELRFLFRQWQRVGSKVQFWRDYDHCEPPWADDATREDWAAYAFGRILRGYAHKQKLRSSHWETLVPLLDKHKAGTLGSGDVQGLWQVAAADKGPLSALVRAKQKPVMTAADFIAMFHSLPADMVNAHTPEAEEST